MESGNGKEDEVDKVTKEVKKTPSPAGKPRRTVDRRKMNNDDFNCESVNLKVCLLIEYAYQWSGVYLIY